MKISEPERKEIHKVILNFIEYNFEGGLKSLKVMETIAKYGS